MAAYQDYIVDPNATPSAIYKEIATLLVGSYSVEVLPEGDTVSLRVWLGAPYEIGDHTEV